MKDSFWFKPSSVRRILKRGGRNFRKFEKNKDQNKKLFRPNSVRFFAQNQVKSKKKKKKKKKKEKKGLHSNLVRFFAQSWVKAYNKRIKHNLCVMQARSQKFAMGAVLGVWGRSPQRSKILHFFCKNNFILGLF